MPYFGSYFGPALVAPASIPVGGDFPAPSRLAVVYATDEDCLVAGGEDFGVIVPASNLVAAGTDGTFVAGYPWVLQSLSSAFDVQGVKAGMVVQITGPNPPFKSPQYFAISAVAATGLTLRRPGMLDGQGLPPNAAKTTTLPGVTFRVATLYPQIENVAYTLNERFSLDPNLSGYRDPSSVYDPRPFRALTVWKVYYLRYMNINRDRKGDFADKVEQYRNQFDEDLAKAVLRWGPKGTTQAPTGRGMRMSR